MNGKQAKRLRRKAIQTAAMLVQSGHTLHEDAHIKRSPAAEPVDDTFSSKPSKPSKPLVQSDTEINRHDTLRGIYRYLKKTK